MDDVTNESVVKLDRATTKTNREEHSTPDMSTARKRGKKATEGRTGSLDPWNVGRQLLQIA